MERKEFAFENDYVKIINPTKDMEIEIVSILKNTDLSEDSGIVSAYHILNKLCIPKNEKYDFSKYSVDVFLKIAKEAHLYDGLQEIINATALISSNATIHELQYMALGLKNQRIQMLLSMIQDETGALNELGKEIYYDNKENKKNRELADLYREKREMKKQIDSFMDGVE